MDRRRVLDISAGVRPLGVCLAGALLISTGLTFGLPLSGASAQTTSYHEATDSVVINLGAIDGSAAAMPAPVTKAAPSPMTYVAPQGGRLMMPGMQPPVSELHIAAPTGAAPVLRQPKPAPAAQPVARMQAPVAVPAAPAAPAPAPMPAEKVAKAEPKPLAPAPKPAPAAPVKKAPPPAPTQSASAPPPPPAAPSAPEPAPPAKTVKKAEKPAAKPQESAAAPTGNDAGKTDGTVQLMFNGADTKLSADAKTALDAIAQKLAGSDALRVQLMAYAAGGDLTASTARRISLSRALSVRSHLIEKGIRSTRIDVRALGDKAENEPKNRVDVSFVGR